MNSLDRQGLPERTGQRVLPTRLLVAMAGLLSALGLLLANGEAHAQGVMHEVTWAHPKPNRVRGFIVYVSPVAGPGAEATARQIDVGKPKSIGTGGGGLRYFSALVQGDVGDFVAVAAIAHDGSRSPLSAWAGLPPTRPGRPRLVER